MLRWILIPVYVYTSKSNLVILGLIWGDVHQAKRDTVTRATVDSSGYVNHHRTCTASIQTTRIIPKRMPPTKYASGLPAHGQHLANWEREGPENAFKQTITSSLVYSPHVVGTSLTDRHGRRRRSQLVSHTWSQLHVAHSQKDIKWSLSTNFQILHDHRNVVTTFPYPYRHFTSNLTLKQSQAHDTKPASYKAKPQHRHSLVNKNKQKIRFESPSKGCMNHR